VFFLLIALVVLSVLVVLLVLIVAVTVSNRPVIRFAATDESANDSTNAGCSQETGADQCLAERDDYYSCNQDCQQHKKSEKKAEAAIAKIRLADPGDASS
jgi:flagellar biosynthesis/type III secretory pathway M-ring protein FliF/YscJ